MSKSEEFLTKEEEQEIVEAIRMADRALEVFHELKMHETQLKNGVLIYLAANDKKFVICGDKGINDVVSEDFWDSTKDVMASQFKTGNFKQGLIDGISKAGEQLRRHFPYEEGDTNELSNEISKG
jgi:uncharacterized membrane protein